MGYGDKGTFIRIGNYTIYLSLVAKFHKLAQYCLKVEALTRDNFVEENLNWSIKNISCSKKHVINAK